MTAKYPAFLSPVVVAGNLIRNRVIATASIPLYIQNTENFATDALITHYVNEARAGAGIVTFNGMMHLGIPEHPPFIDDTVPAVMHSLTKMTDLCHLYGAKCITLFNSVLESSEEFDCSDGVPPNQVKGETFVRGNLEKKRKAWSHEQLLEIVQDYVKYARYAKECGFDGCNIHMGYRMGQPARFLSPITNRRTDEYGGSLENRCRFPLMICKAIKEACGQNFIIEVKLCGAELEPGSWSLEDTAGFAKLADGVIDIFQISAPVIDPQSPCIYEPEVTPYREQAKYLKKRFNELGTSVRINTVCGYRAPEVFEEVIAGGEADFIGVSRALIADPDFLKKAYAGKGYSEIVPCLRCNKCHVYKSAGYWNSVCSVNPQWGHIAVHPEAYITKPQARKKVAVVGGGPAGIYAAKTLSERGHEVVLYEMSDRLGGLLNYAEVPEFKWTIRDYKAYMIRELKKTDVRILLGTKATQELLDREGYDEIIAAVGSEPLIPPIPGADGKQIFTCLDVFSDYTKLGKNVVIIGGGEIGVEAGLYLAQNGHTAVSVEMQDDIAKDACPIHYRAIFADYWKNQAGFSYIVNARVMQIAQDGVVYQKDGSENMLHADSIVLAAGMKSRSMEAAALYAPGTQLRLIGDCVKPADILMANRAAFITANSI